MACYFRSKGAFAAFIGAESVFDFYGVLRGGDFDEHWCPYYCYLI